MIHPIQLIVAVAVLHSQTARATLDDLFDLSRKTLRPRGDQLEERQSNDGYIQVPVINVGGYTYNINITVGTPPQPIQIQIDTGSPSPWIPASNDTECQDYPCSTGTFNPSRSSTYSVVEAGGFNASYLSYGDFDAGDWANDTFGFGDETFLSQQLFGLAYSGADSTGVLGLMPGTPSATLPDWGAYPALIDEMESQGLIGRKAFSLYLNDFYAPEGSLLFGAVDTTKYKGDLVALPIPVDGYGSRQYYDVTLTGVSFTNFNGTTLSVSRPDLAAALSLDSGTPTIMLPFSIFTRLAEGFGAVFSDAAGDSQYVVPCSYKEIPGTINFQLGGPDGIEIQIPLSRLFGEQVLTHHEFDDHSGACEFMISPTSEYAGILGDPFLRNVYAVYDATNNLTAVAQAVLNQTYTSNIITMGADETTIPGATRTGSASATFFYVTPTYTNPSAVAPTTKHGHLETAAPTFNLGHIPSGAASLGKELPFRAAAVVGVVVAMLFAS